MSVSQASIISNILASVDSVGVNLVQNTYRNLVNDYSALFYILTTIYIGFCYIKVMRGHLEFKDLTFVILRAICILTLALRYDYFCKLIYDIFTNLPLDICKSITFNSSGNVSIESVSSAIDQYLSNGLDLCKQLFTMSGWSNPIYLLFGFIVFMLISASAAFAVGLIILAKCASMILLSLSPLFIFAALFDSTKGLFDSYIQHLITYALIPIVTCAILMIILSVANVVINNANLLGSITLTNVTPLCLVSVIQIYLLTNVKSKCAGLAGGFNLPNIISKLPRLKMSSDANSKSFGGENLPELKGSNNSNDSSKSSSAFSRQSADITKDRIKEAGVKDRSQYTYPKNKY